MKKCDNKLDEMRETLEENEKFEYWTESLEKMSFCGNIFFWYKNDNNLRKRKKC